MAFERDPYKLFPHDRLLAATLLRLIPRWVTPNMVTTLRFVLIPFVLATLSLEWWAVAVPLFLCTALTDAVDGSLARTRKQVTEWGTFFDPAADKLLIGSVVLLLVAQRVSPWFALLILGVEALIITGGFLRKRRGVVTPANVFGKTKMFLQVVGVTFLLIAAWTDVGLYQDLSVGTLSVAVVFALISLFTYGL